MVYDFPIILGMSSSQLTKSIIFQDGEIAPPTRYFYLTTNPTNNFSIQLGIMISTGFHIFQGGRVETTNH